MMMGNEKMRGWQEKARFVGFGGRVDDELAP